jgi:hypothetical protein
MIEGRRKLSLGLAGDVCAHRADVCFRLHSELESIRANFLSPFAHCNVILCNFEGPLTTSETAYANKPTS